MTEEQSLERAYKFMAITLAPSWIEETGSGKMRPKAKKLRDMLAREMRRVYAEGQRSMQLRLTLATPASELAKRSHETFGSGLP